MTPLIENLTAAQQGLQAALNASQLNPKSAKQQLQNVRISLLSHNQPFSVEENELLNAIFTFKARCTPLNHQQRKKLETLFLAIHNIASAASIPVAAQPLHVKIRFANETGFHNIPQSTAELLRLHANYFQAFERFQDKQELHFPNVTRNAFDKIAAYLLTSQYPVCTDQDIAELAAAADFLEIPQLIAYCKTHLNDMLGSVSYDDLVPLLAEGCMGTPEALPQLHLPVFDALINIECCRLFNHEPPTFTALTAWLQAKGITLADFLTKAQTHFPQAARYFRCLLGQSTLKDHKPQNPPSLLDGLCSRLVGHALDESYTAPFAAAFQTESNAQSYFYLYPSCATPESMAKVFTKGTDAPLLTNWAFPEAPSYSGEHDTESLRRHPRMFTAMLEQWDTEQNWEHKITIVDRFLDEDTSPRARLICESWKIKAQTKLGLAATPLTYYPLNRLDESTIPLYFTALFDCRDYKKIYQDLQELAGKGFDNLLQPFRLRYAAINLEIWADDLLMEGTEPSLYSMILWELCQWGIKTEPFDHFDHSTLSQHLKSTSADDSFTLSCQAWHSQQEGNYPQAIKQYTKALAKGAPNGIRYHLARCYLALNKQNDALKSMQGGGSLLSRNPLPLLLLENELGMPTDFEASLHSFEPALQNLWKARYLFASGSTSEALAMLESLHKETALPIIAAALSQLYLSQGDFNQAYAVVHNYPSTSKARDVVLAKAPLPCLNSDIFADEGHSYLLEAVQVKTSYELPTTMKYRGELGFWSLLNFWHVHAWEDKVWGGAKQKQAILQRILGELKPEIKSMVPYFLAFAERNDTDVLKEFENHRALILSTPYRALAADVCRRKGLTQEATQILGKLDNDWSKLVHAMLTLHIDQEAFNRVQHLQETAFLPHTLRELATLALIKYQPNVQAVLPENPRLEELVFEKAKATPREASLASLKVLANSPLIDDNKEVRVLLVSKLIHSHYFTAALQACEQLLITQYPLDAQVQDLYGVCLYSCERYAEALPYLANALAPLAYPQLTGEVPRALMCAECYYYTGQVKQTLATLKGFADEQPHHQKMADTLRTFASGKPSRTSHDHYLAAKWHFAKNEYATAAERLKKVRNQRRSKPHTFRLLKSMFLQAQCYLNIGRMLEAKELITALKSQEQKSLESLGLAFFEQVKQWERIHLLKRKVASSDATGQSA